VTAPRASRRGDSSYHRFWHDVGDDFPDLAGAPSTLFYRDNEIRLLQRALPALAGLRILKTDLWDEAKNTHILQWAARGGALAFGIDLSTPIVREARRNFGGTRLRAAVSDVRALPFVDAAFDAIYSMGTVEHFDETEQAVREIYRVLKPGGVAVIGVPNRHDPFLRPALAAVMQAFNWYGYGYEKSYSRKSWRAMLDRAGFEIVDESGILFVPGWLRMLDLWCHTSARPLTSLTRIALAPFAWLHRHVRATHRHGYLLATVARRPSVISTSRSAWPPSGETGAGSSLPSVLTRRPRR
jgi:SAM-dependent methyltransferase